VFYNKRILEECDVVENGDAAETITTPYFKGLTQ
jgi:hypothetical protein